MSHKSVLIIEDDAAVRNTLKDVLEINGYTVNTANDGKEGETQLRSLKPPPCLILLDLMMPNTNGWQFLDFQRNDPALKDIPVVICSAYEQSAKAVAPSAFLAKPVQLDQLLGAVKTFCF